MPVLSIAVIASTAAGPHLAARRHADIGLEEDMNTKNDLRAGYVTRDSILKLLSDDEVSRVSTGETAAQLTEGEEYLDLEQLERGPLRAPAGGAAPMGRVLQRKAVLAATWSKVMAHLAQGGAEDQKPAKPSRSTII